MSKKGLKSMKNENPELQKQIGCITGFFQLFDCQHFLTGQHTSIHSQHRLTSGRSSNDIKEQTMQKAMAKNLNVAREKQQFSTESSINSMSSSPCSSSLSSLAFNRIIQTESPSTDRMKVPEKPNSEVAMKQLGVPGQKSLNFHDIARDSMHREAQGLSVKTVAKEEKKGQTHTLKYIDSPRPLQSHKSVNAGVMVANEPFHMLAKSKKKPWDSPRLSYDGRDIKDTLKSATKHKELPRLSLDSREGSIRGFNEGNKSCNLLKGPEKGYGRNSTTMLSQQREPETSKRSSSVVAKLMGLEAPPDWTQACEISLGTYSCSTNKNEILARSSTSSVSPRTCQGSTLHQSRRVDSITNVAPYSRFAPESTLWRQLDASQSSQLQASKGSESDIKALKSSPSIYGEIEERLTELEFKKSGKDLRALKQILEAMHRYKDSLDITRDQASNSPSYIRNNSRFDESLKVQSPRIRPKDLRSVTDEMPNSTQGSESPIVIMKPAKVNRKANNTSSREMSVHRKSGLNKCSPGNHTSGRLVNKQTAKGISSSADKCDNIRNSKLMQSSKVPGDSNGKNTTTNSGNLTMTGSPRLQNKYGSERRSPPTSPSSDCSINRKHNNRQSVELSSPSRTPIKKFSTLQERNERVDEISCHWRDFKHHVNVISPDFDSKRSLITDSDIEVIHIDQSSKINSTSIHGLNQNNAFEKLSKESSKAETIVTAEQPSPVSVLEAAFYREDPPSPVKKKSGISKDLGEALSANDDSEENSMDLHPLSSTTMTNFSTSDRGVNTQNLVPILQEIEWIDEKLISFNDNKDPDHKYISEILLASGLFSSPSSSQIFHSPGHLINPKLFFELEQTMTNKRHSNTEDSAKKIARINLEQMQRKLIFDVVNEILVRKLVSDNSSSMWCIPNKLAGRKLKGQQVLVELCTEIDQLQPQNKNVSLANEDDNLTSLMWGDLMHHHPTIWTNCCSEMPNIVLDIERLIFKDLITEVVRGEVANHPGRHCRQLLFPK